MTPDPTPYLLPTDLRTAEDAAAFVRTYVVDPATEWDLSDVYNYLERRLDRERRQACRRAARYEITMARAFWRAGGGVQHLLAIAHTERALAFRAAARAK